MSISANHTGAHAAAILASAVNQWNANSSNSDIPTTYITALRTGIPGVRYQVSVDERTINVTPARFGAPPYNPDRERASWNQLCLAFRAAELDGIQPELPHELTMAVWTHNGREIRICQPGTAPAIRNARERLRRRLTALSPLPLLGALSQPVAGSATAVGIAVAPIPPMHSTPPAPPPVVVREMNGEINRPPLPWLSASHPEHGTLAMPTTPAPSEPGDTPAADTVSPPAVTPTRRTAPGQPAASTPTHRPALTTTSPASPTPAHKAAPTASPNRHVHRHEKRHKPHPLRGRGRR